MTKKALYLEDLNIGDTFKSEEFTLSKNDIITFAKQYDPQNFHIDEDLAKDTFFNTLSASGWHTAAATMRVLVDSIPLASGMIGAGVELSWPNPVHPGDTLSTTSVIKDITYSQSKPDQGIVVLESTVTNQNNEVCMINTSKLVTFRSKS